MYKPHLDFLFHHSWKNLLNFNYIYEIIGLALWIFDNTKEMLILFVIVVLWLCFLKVISF